MRIASAADVKVEKKVFIRNASARLKQQARETVVFPFHLIAAISRPLSQILAPPASKVC